MKKMIYVCSPCRPTAKDPATRAIQKVSNITRAKTAGRRIALNGGIPIIPHLYFTELLDDETPEERAIGMELGLDMLAICDEVWVITDDVISDGMMKEIELAAELDIPVRMFNSKGVENKHIQGLVKMLKENADEKDDLNDIGDDMKDEDAKENDPSDSGEGGSDYHTGDADALIDSVIERIVNFVDSDKNFLGIRIVKLDED